MTAAEIQAQLDQVNTAITRALAGPGAGTAEFWEGGDRWRGHGIEALFTERARLEKKLAAVSTGPRFGLIKVVDL